MNSAKMQLYTSVSLCRLAGSRIAATLILKVGFSASLTLMAIFFANVSLKYGYVCIILDFLPRSTKKEYLFLKYR